MDQVVIISYANYKPGILLENQTNYPHKMMFPTFQPITGLQIYIFVAQSYVRSTGVRLVPIHW